MLGFHFCFFIWSASRNIFVHSPITKGACTVCSVCDSTIIVLFNWHLIDSRSTYLFFLSERTFNNSSVRSLSVKHLGTSELSIPSLFPHCAVSIRWLWAFGEGAEYKPFPHNSRNGDHYLGSHRSARAACRSSSSHMGWGFPAL